VKKERLRKVKTVKGMNISRTTGRVFTNLTLLFLCFIWCLPTIGVLITSFRERDNVNQSGWWTVLDGSEGFTAENYEQVLGGKEFSYYDSDNNLVKERSENLLGAFLNSLTVTIPAVVIPILIAAFAAYGFAWLDFPGRKVLFVGIVAILVVPLQISLIPILSDYKAIGLNGTFLGIWLAHTGFGLPLAIYLLFNYISSIPRSIMESAFIDGYSHFDTFIKIILPLSVPALASFAIFQFIWVWNDLLVALVFLGTGKEVQVMTQKLLNMVGTRGQDWHLLTAGAFVSMVLPLIVFFGLQRYFVRGLMTGSVKY
jgi:alpha-glucoside transport system permease protein